MKVLKVELKKSNSKSYVEGLEDGWKEYKFWFLLESEQERTWAVSFLSEFIPQKMRVLYEDHYLFEEKYTVENEIQAHIRGNLVFYTGFFQDNRIVESCVNYLTTMKEEDYSIGFHLILRLIQTLNLWID